MTTGRRETYSYLYELPFIQPAPLVIRALPGVTVACCEPAIFHGALKLTGASNMVSFNELTSTFHDCWLRALSYGLLHALGHDFVFAKPDQIMSTIAEVNGLKRSVFFSGACDLLHSN